MLPSSHFCLNFCQLCLLPELSFILHSGCNGRKETYQLLWFMLWKHLENKEVYEAPKDEDSAQSNWMHQLHQVGIVSIRPGKTVLEIRVLTTEDFLATWVRNKPRIGDVAPRQKKLTKREESPTDHEDWKEAPFNKLPVLTFPKCFLLLDRLFLLA